MPGSTGVLYADDGPTLVGIVQCTNVHFHPVDWKVIYYANVPVPNQASQDIQCKADILLFSFKLFFHACLCVHLPPFLFAEILRMVQGGMEGVLPKMRNLPWRGMLALLGGFLITVFSSPIKKSQ